MTWWEWALAVMLGGFAWCVIAAATLGHAFRRGHRPPAPGEKGLPPVDPGAATRHPPGARRPPSGAGLDPAHPHDLGLPPDAGAPVPPVVRRFDVLDCGSTTSYRCVTIYDTRDRSTVHVQCPEHRIGFNIAEWEARLRQ